MYSEFSFFSDMAIEHILDTTYSTNYDYQGVSKKLKMDLHYPNMMIDQSQLRPLVILVHGGEYLSGSKSDLEYLAMKFAKAGYVAANIDYRQGWDNGLGACNGDTLQLKKAMYRGVQDLNDAFSFLSNYATSFKIDTNTVFLIGQSEGAMIAMHTAFLNQTSADIYFAGMSATLGGIEHAGNPYNNALHIKGIFNWCGAILDTNMIQSDKAIPVLSIHGMLDSVIFTGVQHYFNCNTPNHQYPLLHGPQSIFKRLNHFGICTQANYDDNGQHCFLPSLEQNNYIPAKSICFFKNILCDNCITEQKAGYNFQSCIQEAPLQTSMLTSENQIDIYPNPCNESFNVKIQFNKNTFHSISISFVNINGIEVWKKNDLTNFSDFYFHKIQIDKPFSKGIYFLKIQIDNETYYKKVTIL